MFKRLRIKPAYYFIKNGKEAEIIGLNSLMLSFAVSSIQKLTGETEDEIFDRLGTMVTHLHRKEPMMINKVGLKLLSTQKPPNSGLGIIEIQIDTNHEEIL